MAKSVRRPTRVMLLVATRKGAFLFHGDPARRQWRLDGPHLLGCVINHLVLDPRDGFTMLMAAKTGHLGPTIYRSTDRGKTWQEAKQPPAFAKAPEGQPGKAVDHVFWLSPGHSSQPGIWWAGTSPHGLFRSDDGGITWSGIEGFDRDRPERRRPSLRGSLDRRLLRELRRRQVVAPPQPRRRGGLPAREGSRAGSRSPYHGAAPAQPRPALPAEPLRHLPARPSGRG